MASGQFMPYDTNAWYDWYCRDREERKENTTMDDKLVEAVENEIRRFLPPYIASQWTQHTNIAQAAITAHLKHLADNGYVIVERSLYDGLLIDADLLQDRINAAGE